MIDPKPVHIYSLSKNIYFESILVTLQQAAFSGTIASSSLIYSSMNSEITNTVTHELVHKYD